ncbi:hypothetical protein ACUHMQ_20560 [Chitinimonas sp. PSY-7]|uniref:hypothetical protein n=1 Tax=Chitinimonas sp. PSY-7 TaxID=3459088 RepID=UPI00404023D4
MQEEIKCINCDGIATLVSTEGAIKTYLCSACGFKFEGIAHYVEQPISLGIKNYRAFVIVPDEVEARKAAFKIRRLFSGLSNFYLEDLQSQLSAGVLELDLGIYSDREVEKLLPQAEILNLNLKFVLVP